MPEPSEDGRLSPSVTLRNPSRLSRLDDGSREDAESVKDLFTPRERDPYAFTFKLREQSFHDSVSSSRDQRRPYKQPVSLRRTTYTPKDRVRKSFLSNPKHPFQTLPGVIAVQFVLHTPRVSVALL